MASFRRPELVQPLAKVNQSLCFICRHKICAERAASEHLVAALSGPAEMTQHTSWPLVRPPRARRQSSALLPFSLITTSYWKSAGQVGRIREAEQTSLANVNNFRSLAGPVCVHLIPIGPESERAQSNGARIRFQCTLESLRLGFVWHSSWAPRMVRPVCKPRADAPSSLSRNGRLT